MLTEPERQRLFNVMNDLSLLGTYFYYATVGLTTHLDHKRILPTLDKKVDEADRLIREYKYLRAKEVVE